MIIDADTSFGTQPQQPRPRHDAQFSAILSQACPLFSPWPVSDPFMRAGFAANGAALSVHAAASGRREGRHTRE